MNKNDKILVAGGSGLVGSAILRRLLNKGYTNIVASYYIRPLDKELQQKVRSIGVDLTNQQATIDLFRTEQPEYVFLAAARVGGIVANNTYKAEFIYQNMMIAANVVDTSCKHGVKKLLNLGSSCIYPKMAPQPMKEEYLLTGELEPTNEPYAVAKIAAIKLCRYYNEQYGTDYLSVMPTNLYGPNDNFDLDNSHVLPGIMRKMHLAKLLSEKLFDDIRMDFLKFGNCCVAFADEEIIINNVTSDESIVKVLNHFGITCNDESGSSLILWGTGEPFREFLYVDDLADALVFIMENCNKNEIGEFVNIGTGIDVTIQVLAEMIQSIVNYRGEIKFDILKPDGTPRKLLDVTRLNDLGWEYTTSLADGIKKMYEWYVAKT